MRRANDAAALLDLGEQFHRAERRIARLKRKVGGDTPAWQRWSAAIEDTLILVSLISRTSASGLPGVSVKLDALIWLLTYDDAILDAEAQRRLQALGREVRALADR